MSSASAPRVLSVWLSLTPFVTAVAAVAVVGSLSASGSSETYESLEQPPYAPPSWLFGPTWTLLYILIALSGWFAWRAGVRGTGIGLWVLQLLLNLAWTPLFFGADRYVLALVDIVLLVVAIVATILAFRRRSALAAWLLVPYLAWVSFATALNAGIVVLN